MNQDNNYIGRAINAGIRNKRRAPFQAPAHARLTSAIRKLYTKTSGAHDGKSRSAMFEIHFILADGSDVGDHFTKASEAVQRGEVVSVQIWEWTRCPSSLWESFGGKHDDGERFKRNELSVAMTAKEFEKHKR